MRLPRLLLLPALLFAIGLLPGCPSGVHECSVSANCPAGEACIHRLVDGAPSDTCEVPCDSGHPCAGGATCGCPGSQTGFACTTDEGMVQLYCQG